MNDVELENVIQAKGLTAPRIQFKDLEAEIFEAQYHRFPGTTTTVCCITMQNGNTVVGESACASPENFDVEVGRDIARKNAVEKMWPLLGFRLRDQLFSDMNWLKAGVTELKAGVTEVAQPSPGVTLGEQVLFFERVAEQESEPMLALVTSMFPSGNVSLAVFAPNGTVHARANVLLLGAVVEAAPQIDYYARRMEQ